MTQAFPRAARGTHALSDNGPGADAGPAARLQRADLVTATLVYLAACAVYAPLALRLATGHYLDYYNLAFDFDPYRTLQTLALSPANLQGFKHPLIILMRPLAWSLVQFGVGPKQAAVLEMVMFGSGTVVCCFLFLRLATGARAEALALTLLFGVTNTQIFTSIITESYGFSGFAIALVWLLALQRLDNPARLRGLRMLAGVMTFAITITNVAQAFIAEMLVHWRQGGLTHAVRKSIHFGLILAAILTPLCVAVWFSDLWWIANHPVLALKDVWWLQTKGPRTGVYKVLQTYFGFSFVAPHFSWLLLPEGTNMLDFRQWSFSPIGTAAVLLWLSFCLVGFVAGLRDRSYRWIALGLGAATLFNLLFATRYQFRGSLFIYAAHLHFTIFALGAGLAPWIASRPPRARSVYIGVVLMLALLVGMNNLRTVAGFVTDFDTITTPCPAPCAGGPA